MLTLRPGEPVVPYRVQVRIVLEVMKSPWKC